MTDKRDIIATIFLSIFITMTKDKIKLKHRALNNTTKKCINSIFVTKLHGFFKKMSGQILSHRRSHLHRMVDRGPPAPVTRAPVTKMVTTCPLGTLPAGSTPRTWTGPSAVAAERVGIREARRWQRRGKGFRFWRIREWCRRKRWWCRRSVDQRFDTI